MTSTPFRATSRSSSEWYRLGTWPPAANPAENGHDRTVWEMALAKDDWIEICARVIANNRPGVSAEACRAFAKSLWNNAYSLSPIEAAEVFEKIYQTAWDGGRAETQADQEGTAPEGN